MVVKKLMFDILVRLRQDFYTFIVEKRYYTYVVVNIAGNRKSKFWPELPYEEWKDTLDTLHMWIQIVGKVKLKLAPFMNHWWEVALYVTPYGLTTGEIPYNNELFVVDIDFLSHNLLIRTSTNQVKSIALIPRAVAEFYNEFMTALHTLGIQVTISTLPSEVSHPIRFEKDTIHASYDSVYVSRFFQILATINPIFERFRTPFYGKNSPVQFFWGSFDLSQTRYSGKRVTPPKNGGRIMEFAENEENFSCGFWPGDEKYPQPAFYSYIYPTPPGMETIQFASNPASFSEKLSECILPYETVRTAKFPDKVVMDFLQTSYEESAKLAGWDTHKFEGPIPSHL